MVADQLDIGGANACLGLEKVRPQAHIILVLMVVSIKGDPGLFPPFRLHYNLISDRLTLRPDINGLI